jgi:hypothetical protein
MWCLWNWEGAGTEADRAILAVMIFSRWMVLVDDICVFEMFGPRVLPIIKSVEETSSFFAVSFLVIFAFTHSSYTLRIHQLDNETGSLYSYFIPIFRIAVLGDGDETSILGNEKEDEPRYAARILFLCTSLAITVLLMSILIGILGSNYDDYVQKSKAMFAHRRACSITHLSSLPWVKWLIWGKEMEGFLWFAVKETGKEEPRQRGRSKKQPQSRTAAWPSEGHATAHHERPHPAHAPQVIYREVAPSELTRRMSSNKKLNVLYTPAGAKASQPKLASESVKPSHLASLVDAAKQLQSAQPSAQPLADHLFMLPVRTPHPNSRKSHSPQNTLEELHDAANCDEADNLISTADDEMELPGSEGLLQVPPTKQESPMTDSDRFALNSSPKGRVPPRKIATRPSLKQLSRDLDLVVSTAQLEDHAEQRK